MPTRPNGVESTTTRSSLRSKKRCARRGVSGGSAKRPRWNGRLDGERIRGLYYYERASLELICCDTRRRPPSAGLVAVRLEIQRVFLRCSLLTRSNSTRPRVSRDDQSERSALN